MFQLDSLRQKLILRVVFGSVSFSNKTNNFNCGIAEDVVEWFTS